MSGFNSAEHYAHVVEVVRENPRLAGEGTFAYIERLAVAAGLMKAGDAVLQSMPSAHGQSDRQRDERLEKLREQASGHPGSHWCPCRRRKQRSRPARVAR